MNPSLPRAQGVLESGCGTLFTGAVARVEQGGRLIFERAYGATRADGDAEAVYVDTRFDLASLTKLFVSTVALELANRGLLPLDAPLIDVVGEWRRLPQSAITSRMLLAHTSGMHSGADYRALFDEDVERYVLLRELAAPPGERVIYSDLGMIALGVVIRRVTGLGLPAALARAFPGLSVGFTPPSREFRMIPATELDAWRGRVQGSVHDEKAHILNGVAGHAGLFGSARDVAALTEVFLAASAGREQHVLAPEIARAAVREQAYDPVLRRGLGWAMKTSDDNSCGRLYGSESFGHTGFTGTCVWADPERDLQALLLTNTVYFGRSDSRPLRAAFFEAVVEDVNA